MLLPKLTHKHKNRQTHYCLHSYFNGKQHWSLQGFFLPFQWLSNFYKQCDIPGVLVVTSVLVSGTLQLALMSNISNLSCLRSRGQGWGFRVHRQTLESQWAVWSVWFWQRLFQPQSMIPLNSAFSLNRKRRQAWIKKGSYKKIVITACYKY